MSHQLDFGAPAAASATAYLPVCPIREPERLAVADAAQCWTSRQRGHAGRNRVDLMLEDVFRFDADAAVEAEIVAILGEPFSER